MERFSRSALGMLSISFVFLLGCSDSFEIAQSLDSSEPSALAPQPVSQQEAARFLTQATFGAKPDEIDFVSRIGPRAWVETQFNTQSMDSHWNYSMVRFGPPNCMVCEASYINAVMESFWLQAIQGPDQLRQRTAFALSQIFVVSNVNSQIDSVVGAHASYLDMLSRNAFGNFRTLLENVSTHPAMGQYLSHFRNEKEDPATGKLPDENFAREIMQLFTIGLWELNLDGSRRLDGDGNPIPTYQQSDVSGLAKVFTGWSWSCATIVHSCWAGWDGQPWSQQMRNYPDHHSSSEKRFLNVLIPANTSGEESLRIALDALFYHPNVGPFIGHQLIQRFVTSNPSPAYVRRVASAFNDNGQRVRGDMRAVLRAVLLDNEAIQISFSQNRNAGKLREPILRFSVWMRAFDVKNNFSTYPIWNLEDSVSSIGQNPLRAPSVFNWYRPDYSPPGDVMARNLVAPEFQISHETTVTGYVNFITYVIERGFSPGHYNSLLPDYSHEISLAGNPDALLDRLNLLLTYGQLSTSTREIVREAIVSIPANQATSRVHTAIALIMVSPDFLVQR